MIHFMLTVFFYVNDLTILTPHYKIIGLNQIFEHSICFAF